MNTVRPQQAPKPLTLREAALCDLMNYYVWLVDKYPGETIGQTKERFALVLDFLRDPATGPKGLEPCRLFPALVGLYPTVVRHPDEDVLDQLAQAAADLLTMAAMCAEDDDGQREGFRAS